MGWGGELSEVPPHEKGVPLGSILSVTLFVVAINNVINVLPNGAGDCIYVDDLSVSFFCRTAVDK